MLSKLIKKDFQATSRYFLPLMIGFIVLSILCKILFEVQFSFVKNDSMIFAVITITFAMLYVIYIIGLYIMTYVFIVIDFYKTMVSEQGYLTHTLPVKTSSLIISKLSIAALWQMITVTLTVLSVLLFFMGHINMMDLKDFLLEFIAISEISLQSFIPFIMISIIGELISAPLMFYASIALGHLFGKHRIIGAIVSYIGIYMLMQIIAVFVMVPMTLSLKTSQNMSLYFSITMWFTLIFTLIISIIFYIITEFVFRKKLNLE